MNASLKNIILTHSNSTNGAIASSFATNRNLFLRIWKLLFFFLSGTITLRTIFFYFHHYIPKAYQYINPHFEKPSRVLFQQYRIAPLFLHLKQWHFANEAESLIQIQYASKPKNPE